MPRKIQRLQSEPRSPTPTTALASSSETSLHNTLAPLDGDSASDLQFARSLVQTLLSAGDIPGALNLAVACRGLVEQRFDLALKDGTLLGATAIARLGEEIVSIISNSLRPIHELDAEAYYVIVEKASARLKAIDL